MKGDGMSKAMRLLKIKQLLEDRPMTVKELADRCDVSRRTIQQDLLELQGEPMRLPVVEVRATLYGLEGSEWPEGLEPER
jgi:predicted DNA-binding transcriptional regulator YafY